MKKRNIWRFVTGEGPLIAAAIHDGHAVRPEVAELLALSEAERRREEDPHTAAWTEVAPTRIVGLHSRFEVDLNRPRAEAVYRGPEDAWGLNVWKGPQTDGFVERSLADYDAFYAEVLRLLRTMESKFDHFFVFDLHAYNHRRGGPDAEPADPRMNPEVNIGTGTMDRAYWAPLVDRFIADLRSFDFNGRRLDVRENVKFVGRGFPRFVHEHCPRTGCALAIEFKKFFMDEWTGELHPEEHAAVRGALEFTKHGVLEELGKLDEKVRHG